VLAYFVLDSASKWSRAGKEFRIGPLSDRFQIKG